MTDYRILNSHYFHTPVLFQTLPQSSLWQSWGLWCRRWSLFY